MKIFFWTVVAVVAGIYIYSKVGTRKKLDMAVSKLRGGIKDITGVETRFEGPDIDQKTGAYLNPGARPGTVEFPSQGN